MTTTATLTDKVKVQFETQPCHRCSGNGYFDRYAGIHGGRCFKCGGTGTVHTRRGASAHKKFTERITEVTRLPLGEIQVGMGVQLTANRKFRKVTAVKVVPSSRIDVNGRRDDGNDIQVSVKNGTSIWQASETMMVRRTSTVEEWNTVANSVRHLAGVTIA